MDCPETEADLAEIVAGSSESLAILGGGTQGISARGRPVSTRALTGVSLYDPGALTMVARTGTPMDEIDRILAGENQQLAFEPRDLRGLIGSTGHPTIGGAFATNLSGPRRIQGGAARDFLLGVRLVDGTGTIVKNGGRVMKNVTGYDLVKLMAGAHGTLGVLSEVSFKVLPRPEMAGTVLLRDLTPDLAVGAMSLALGSPFDVTGAAHGDWDNSGTPVTAIRVEGFEASVRYRTGELVKRLAGAGKGTVELDPAANAALWRAVRDVEPYREAVGSVWRISVKPGDAPGLLRRLMPDRALLDWGGGLIWALLLPDRDARAEMIGTPGHATLIRGEGFDRFHPEPAPLATLANGLRRQFDPRGILNPGLMG